MVFKRPDPVATDQGSNTIGERDLHSPESANRWFRAFLARPYLSGFLLTFLLVLTCKQSTLLQPAVWDTAMGTFPPAIYLVRHGFDLLSLLQEPGWAEAGPNVHPLSLVTWVTAGVMLLTNNGSLHLVLLHLSTLALTTWALVNLFRLAQPWVGGPLALGVATATFICPVVFVQSGYMYSEIPVMALGIAAVLHWARGNRWRAVVYCAIGLMVKSTIVAVAGGISLAILFERGRKGRRLLQLSALALVPLSKGLITYWWRSPITELLHLSWSEYVQQELLGRLAAAPDLLTLVLGVPLVASLRIRHVFVGLGTASDTADGRVARTRSMVLLAPCIFLGSLLALPLVGPSQFILPRYTVAIIPFCLLGLLGTLADWSSRSRAGAACVLILVGFSANLDGRLYPLETGSFSVIERSMQYRAYQQVQIDGLRSLATKPDAVPAFYCRGDAYMSSDPLMGYLERPIANSMFIHSAGLEDWSLEDFPPHFYLLLSNEAHGGFRIGLLVWEARQTEHWDVGVLEFSAGPFRSYLFELVDTSRLPAQAAGFEED